MMSHYTNKGSRRQFLAAMCVTVAVILVETFLRVRFVRTVNNATVFDAALQGSMLAAISEYLSGSAT